MPVSFDGQRGVPSQLLTSHSNPGQGLPRAEVPEQLRHAGASPLPTQGLLAFLCCCTHALSNNNFSCSTPPTVPGLSWLVKRRSFRAPTTSRR